jgi:hypothetical protein
MFGGGLTVPVPDVDRTDFLLMLGANPYESNGSLATAPDWPGKIEALLERGGTLVVVDPRRSRTAQVASQHVAVRPGADPFLLMALVDVLAADGLIRRTGSSTCHRRRQVVRLAGPFPRRCDRDRLGPRRNPRAGATCQRRRRPACTGASARPRPSSGRDLVAGRRAQRA